MDPGRVAKGNYREAPQGSPGQQAHSVAQGLSVEPYKVSPGEPKDTRMNIGSTILLYGIVFHSFVLVGLLASCFAIFVCCPVSIFMFV